MPSHLPSLETLRAFTVFAETRNLSEAARRLHLSQPALHAKIAGLAELLDMPLYGRRGSAIELTARGNELARFARALLERAQGGLARVREGLEPRQVVLSAGTGAYLYLLGPALQRFRRLSDAQLRLMTANEAASLDAVRSGEADIAVATLPRDEAGVERRELRRFGQVLLVPVGHALAKRRRLSLADLQGLPLVLPPRGRPHRERIVSALAEHGVDADVVAEADGWHLMMKFAALGVGYAIVNDYCERPRGMVAVSLPELPKQALHLCRAATREEREPAAQVLWDLLSSLGKAA